MVHGGREWSFAEGFTEEGRTYVLNNLVTFQALSHEGKPKVLGSGFIIHACAGHALCVTAAHVLDFAYRVLGIESPRAQSVAPGFEVRRDDAGGALGEAFRNGLVLATGVVNNQPVAATFGMACWMRNIDLGFVGLRSPAYLDGHLSFGINSDFFEPGTDVFALRSLDQMALAERASRPGRLRISVTPKIEARAGTIRRVMRRSFLAKGPAYELTLAIPPGMSGGPVILTPKAGVSAQIQVIAVASHGGLDNTVDDPNVPGAGTAIHILNAYALGHATGETLPLLHLARNGTIRDHGLDWPSTEFSMEGDTLNIHRRLGG